MNTGHRGSAVALYRPLRWLQLWFGYGTSWRRIGLPVPCGIMLGCLLAAPFWLVFEYRLHQAGEVLDKRLEDRAAIERAAVIRSSRWRRVRLLRQFIGGLSSQLPDSVEVRQRLTESAQGVPQQLISWRATPISDRLHRYQTSWRGHPTQQAEILRALIALPWPVRLIRFHWSTAEPAQSSDVGLLKVNFELLAGQRPGNWPDDLSWPETSPDNEKTLSVLLAHQRPDLSGSPPLVPLPDAGKVSITTAEPVTPALHFSGLPLTDLTYRGHLTGDPPRALLHAQRGSFEWVAPTTTVGRKAWRLVSVKPSELTVVHQPSGQIALWPLNQSGPGGPP